jgi:TonB family protein
MKNAFIIIIIASNFAFAQNLSHSKDSTQIFENDTISDPASAFSSIECIYRPEIIFPPELRSVAQNATVVVHLFVDSSGIVRKTKVFKSSNKAFNKIALKYASEYRFKCPKELTDGWMTLRILFKQ